MYNQPWNTFLMEEVTPQLKSKANLMPDCIYKAATIMTNNDTIQINFQMSLNGAPSNCKNIFINNWIIQQQISCQNSLAIFSSHICFSNKRYNLLLHTSAFLKPFLEPLLLFFFLVVRSSKYNSNLLPVVFCGTFLPVFLRHCNLAFSICYVW